MTERQLGQAPRGPRPEQGKQAQSREAERPEGRDPQVRSGAVPDPWPGWTETHDPAPQEGTSAGDRAELEEGVEKT